MKTFCNEVVADIKAAKNEAELIKVISYSMSRIRHDKNTEHEFRYINDIIGALRNIDLAVAPDTPNNIKLAIAILRQFLKENSERIS
ncbi:hypothetical protein ACFQ21_25540 [Ohtaekwangia kribbensis]|jgi:hypothetical protein|uniref:Uncharacterized protein n=1 Tax=Ohtaekwangia kribbensis TaxID=688913 RepID=A0ABW3KAH5_9BACT